MKYIVIDYIREQYNFSDKSLGQDKSSSKQRSVIAIDNLAKTTISLIGNMYTGYNFQWRQMNTSIYIYICTYIYIYCIEIRVEILIRFYLDDIYKTYLLNCLNLSISE